MNQPLKSPHLCAVLRLQARGCELDISSRNVLASRPRPPALNGMSNPFDEPPPDDEPLDADILDDVDALMHATNLDELMSPADVAVLRGLLETVQQDTSLHVRLHSFIGTHCHEFASYSASEDCEHKLEWVRLCIEHAH